MASIINASTLAPGLVQSGDASGVLQLQSDGVTGLTVTGANVAIAGNLSLTNLRSTSTTPPTIQNSTGTEIGTFCRAWVNFNGTGTVAIRAAFNVSSITDGGTGKYTINFATSFEDSSYSVVLTGSANDYTTATFSTLILDTTPMTNSNVTILCQSSASGANTDSLYTCVCAFR